MLKTIGRPAASSASRIAWYSGWIVGPGFGPGSGQLSYFR